MRVLLIAESANPDFISVPLVGWSHSVAISRRCNALVVTQIRNREAFLRAGMQEGTEFEAINSEWLAKPLYRINQILRKLGLGWTATTAMAGLAYYAFERALCQQFHDRLMAGEFDLVHRVTPLSPTVPSLYLSRLCERAGVPLVIGPINGGVPWPKEFWTALRAEGEWLSCVRSAYKLLPGHKKALRTVSAIIVGSQDTLQQIPPRHKTKCVYVVENAIEPSRFSIRSEPFLDYPMKVAFVGRLVPYKGCDMVLEALADLVREGRIIVNVFGDGPERAKLEAFCNRNQIEYGVKFHGWVKHSELQGKLVDNHLFVFPSIREFGGGVVLEAMALGIVPVVVAYGGPGELVTPNVGFKIPMGSRPEIVSHLRATVTEVVDNPTVLLEMRQSGLDRVKKHFTWDAKAQKTIEVYKWVLQKRETKPDTDLGFSSLDLENDTPNRSVASHIG